MAEITSDILVDCNSENRRGGAKRMWVANRDNVSSFTAGSVHDYTAVTMDATSDVFFEVEFEFETLSVSQEGSTENGSAAGETTIEVFVPKQDKTKGKDIQDLFESCKLVVVIETFNVVSAANQAFVYGYDEILKEKGALVMAVSPVLEGELQGQNGYNLTFTGKWGEIAREFVGSLPTNLDGNVTLGS